MQIIIFDTEYMIKEITESEIKIIDYHNIFDNDSQSEYEEIAKKERRYLLKQLNIITDYKYRNNPPYPELNLNQMTMIRYLLPIQNSVHLLDLRGWHCQEYLDYIPTFALRAINEAGYYFSHIYLYHNEYIERAEELYDELRPAPAGGDPIVIGNPIRSKRNYLICQWGKDIITPSQLDKMFNKQLKCVGRGSSKWKFCRKGVNFDNDLTTSKFCTISKCSYLGKDK